MSLRKVTSLTALLAFILMMMTSVILYITPQGKIAFWANWSCWGIGKEEWGALHTNLGILFIIAGLIHTVLNWKPILVYLRNRAGKFSMFTGSFNAALGITLVITLMTLFNLPPIRSIQMFNAKLKGAAAKKYGQPPYGHAEASTLKSFCKRIGLNVSESIQALEKAELSAVAADKTLAEIAQANNITPQHVYALIKPNPADGQVGSMPNRPGMGFGRKSLNAVCSEFDLDVQKTISGLKGLDIEADAESSMKALAEKNGMEPYDLFEAIRQLQE